MPSEDPDADAFLDRLFKDLDSSIEEGKVARAKRDGAPLTGVSQITDDMLAKVKQRAPAYAAPVPVDDEDPISAVGKFLRRQYEQW